MYFFNLSIPPTILFIERYETRAKIVAKTIFTKIIAKLLSSLKIANELIIKKPICARIIINIILFFDDMCKNTFFSFKI